MNYLLKYCFSGENNELNAVSAFSEIVPDTVVFDDFERYDISLPNETLVTLLYHKIGVRHSYSLRAY